MRSPGGRIGRLDIGLTAAISVIGLALMTWAVSDAEMTVIGVPLFLLVTLPLLWRSTAPLLGTSASLLGLLVHVVAVGGVVRCGPVFVIAFLFAFSAAAGLERGPALAGLLLALALGTAVSITDPAEGADIAAMGFIGPVTVAVWAVGRLVRSRRGMADELKARTSELSSARDDRARLEVATERSRLSGELDELLQRRLGELAALADGAAREGDPETASATLRRIEDESRRTLEEMRTVVGVLRNDDEEADTAPQPTLTHLEAMVLRAKGSEARLDVEGSPRALPAGVELSAYRIVEHLLEALDDAPGVGVTVRFADDALELSVTGPVRRRGERAIQRARERVQLHHGTLEASTSGGRAQAQVSLPLYATV